MYICITGRETELARAELEAVFGIISPAGKEVALIEGDEYSAEVFENLGFTKKVARVVLESSRKKLAADIAATILANSLDTTGKISFGISWHADLRCDRRNYLEMAKAVKKIIQASGRSARFVQPKEGFQLNAAQVHFNNLLGKGCEIIIYGSADQISMALTTWVFDPTAYSKRDYDRPARSAKVGMFPPKLAQVLINLTNAPSEESICDPFCGSGVVLQEAMRSGHSVIGSDNSSEMVSAAKQNLSWFARAFQNNEDFRVSEADARKFVAPTGSYSIVSEGYLGPALSETTTDVELKPIQSELEKLYLDFLQTAAKSSNQPHCVVITAPFWKTSQGFSFLKLIDQIKALGYTIRQFDSVDSTKLYYRRTGQVVGRQVFVLDLLQR